MAKNTYWFRDVRPESTAGGFSRYDGAIQFFSRINALLQSDFIVLDLGAGRGAAHDDKCTYRRSLRILQGKVQKVVGADIDEAVSGNPIIDEFHILTPGQNLPFPDASFNLILCEWVLEHIDDPAHFQSEIERVLKPGGWFCARTPNKWGLTALVARLVPNRLHTAFLHILQPKRQDIDVFPTRYRLNTMRDVAHRFPPQKWTNASYSWAGEPKYHADNVWLWRVMAVWNWLTPSYMATDLFIFLNRKAL